MNNKTDSGLSFNGVLSLEVNHALVKTPVNFYGKDRPFVFICPNFGCENCGDCALMNSFSKKRISNASVNYRGIGKSEGQFSFESAVYDTRMVFNSLVENFPVSKENLWFYGCSFGSAIAVNAAVEIGGVENMIAVSPVFDTSKLEKDGTITRVLKEWQGRVRGDPEQIRYSFGTFSQNNNPSGNYIFMSPQLVLYNPGESAIPECAHKGQSLTGHLNLKNFLLIHNSNNDITPSQSDGMFASVRCQKERVESISLCRSETDREVVAKKITDFLGVN